MHFIHIAGTNGKGSVSRFLSFLSKIHRFENGCYTSPHLKSVVSVLSLVKMLEENCFKNMEKFI